MQDKQRDHRWSARQDMRIPVSVYSGGEEIGNATSRNIGIGGLFVEMPTQSSSRPTSVMFRVDGKHHKISVEEIWRDSTGIGMMFTDFNAETVCTLRDVLYPEK